MKKTAILILFSLIIQLSYSQTDITSNEIYNHIEFLSNDTLQGRFPGTSGDLTAANYIRDEFKSYGLELLFNNGFQYFDIQTKTKATKKSLSINNFSCKYIEEYQPLMFSPSGNFEGQAIFAGYGMNIQDSSFSWNDYENIDAQGKWVVIFRGIPNVASYPVDFFDTQAAIFSKVIEAQDNGAIGVIFINPAHSFPNDDLIEPCFSRVKQQTNIPAFSVKRFTGDRILKTIGKSVDELESSIKRNNAPLTYELNCTIAAELEIEPVMVTTQNVVAMLQGTDSIFKNQYIVIGAHFDHLGFGGCGSGSMMPDTFAVHNGADDNASGVAGVLEIAEFLSKQNLKKSIIFITFGAEERGLLGSDYFVNNLPVNKDSINGMLNFDMIGKYNRNLSILGTGTALEFENLVAQIKVDTNILKVKTTQKAYSGSDHASFIKSGIPALFFYASSGKDYHTPFDDIQFIDTESEKNVLNFIADFTILLSNDNQKLTFQEVKSQDNNGGNNHSKGGVKFGIIPSFDDTGNKGLKIGDVVANGAAANAGMLSNDIITAIDNQPVTNIYDYMARLQKLKAGDNIKVKINRNGDEIELDVQL
ncbi:MAG: M28 family peptidase [Bacteroidales bacterium]|nr:M28 family peptidase [Bacteroidales bacterium]